MVGQKYRVEERLALDVALVSQDEVTARNLGAQRGQHRTWIRIKGGPT